MADNHPPIELAFAAEVFHWRGPAPFVFVAVPEALAGEVSYAARTTSYGWGMVPVKAIIGGVRFTTSLFPKDGSYVLPLRVAVRKQAGIGLGETIEVVLRLIA